MAGRHRENVNFHTIRNRNRRIHYPNPLLLQQFFCFLGLKMRKRFIAPKISYIPASNAPLSADVGIIEGEEFFYLFDVGADELAAELFGLPFSDGVCMSPVFGFHIHSGAACSGTESDPFADTGTHYNPNDCPHPYHAGDLPPLFGNQYKLYYVKGVFLFHRRIRVSK